MKRIALLMVLFCGFNALMAQDAAKTYTGAEIQFDKTVLNLGELNVGDVKETYFTFTNIGKKPLI